MGVLCIISIIGMVSTASLWTVAWAGVLGFAAGGAFALGLTLPPLLSAPHDVARMSAAMFTVSYTGAVIVSVLAGATWDLSGAAAFAFVPIGLAALPLVLLAPSIKFAR
jgi:CP family cyanate transporter-like MFS transporter